VRRFAREVLSAALVEGAVRIRPVDIDDLAVSYLEPITTYPIDPNLLVLAALARQPTVETAFEIGTFRGNASFAMAAAGASVTTIDISDDDPVIGSAFAGRPEEARITRLVGDSTTFDFSPFHGTADLVYVDGAHDYDHVRNDTEKSLPLLTTGGIVAWDDYPNEPGVYRYLNEFAAENGELLHVRGTRLVLFAPEASLLGDRR
jgi:predicted O-methyltransferase YrrM